MILAGLGPGLGQAHGAVSMLQQRLPHLARADLHRDLADTGAHARKGDAADSLIDAASGQWAFGKRPVADEQERSPRREVGVYGGRAELHGHPHGGRRNEVSLLRVSGFDDIRRSDEQLAVVTRQDGGSNAILDRDTVAPEYSASMPPSIKPKLLAGLTTASQSTSKIDPR